MNRRWTLLLTIGAGTLHQGCFGGDGRGGCDGASIVGKGIDTSSCPVPQKPQALRGTDDEGRVQITAQEAWPNRAEEPPRLTADEVANGCAAYVACNEELTRVALGWHDFLMQSCVKGSWVFSTEREERAIPWSGNERFPVLIREILAARGDCAAIGAIATDAPGWLYCEEDGCIAKERHEVRCEGDVAVFDDGTRRDCSRALATCSTTSETGCTDRPFTRCEDGARGKCDGDVKLDCDGCGFVSFHDCAWNGGHCVETDTELGAECVPPDASGCEGLQAACKDGGFERCVFGQKVRVDCGAIGMECEMENHDGSSCADQGVASPCGLSHCREPIRPRDGGAP